MSKSKVAIVTDSTCNLSDDVVKMHNIHVIPQILQWDGETMLDGIDITPDVFFKRLAASETLPTTSQPTPGDFRDFFLKVGEQAESIVAICISDELSGTLNSAFQASKMIDDIPIEIVDSRSVSMGLGLIVLAAAQAVQDGKSQQEVADIARSLVPRVKVLFVVDTLEYLHKGGRIGGAAKLFGSMLSMKPVLQVKDGRVDTLAKIRTKKKALSHLLDLVVTDTAGKKDVYASIIAAVAPEDRDMLLKEVQERVGPVQLSHSELTPVIGTHGGPGTVGIAYYY